MEVIEHEDERLRGQRLKQDPNSSVDAIPLVLQRLAAAAAETRQRGKQASQLNPHLFLEALEPPRLEALQVLVHRVHEHPERQITLQLGSRARQHEISL